MVTEMEELLSKILDKALDWTYHQWNKSISGKTSEEVRTNHANTQAVGRIPFTTPNHPIVHFIKKS